MVANWDDILNATELDYQPGTLTVTMTYRLEQSDTYCHPDDVVYTNEVTVTVFDELTPGTATGTQAICNGETPEELSATAPSGGSVAPGKGNDYSYQWQYYTSMLKDGVLWNDITSATSLTYQPGTLTQTMTYRLRQTDAYCTPDQEVYTNEVTVFVFDELKAGTASGTQTICYGETPAELTASEPTGGSVVYGKGPIGFEYQWQVQEGADWIDILNATDLSYQPGIVTTTLTYRLQQTDSYCNPDDVVTTNEVTVTMSPLTIYRSATTGDWKNASTWEQQNNGVNWVAATSYPGGTLSYCGSPLATIRNGHTVTMEQHESFGSVVVEEGGELILGEDPMLKAIFGLEIIATHTLTVESGGTLNLRGETGLVRGAGDFVLQSGATIYIGSDLGISKTKDEGNVINSGLRYFDEGATYIYNGTQNQVPGDGLPETFENLTVDNPDGMTLTGDYQIEGTLNLLNGIIFTNGYVLIVENDDPNAVSEGSQESYVRGKLQRFIRALGGSYLFPVGNNPYTPVTIDFDAGSDPGALTVSTTATDHPQIGTSELNASHSVNRQWNIEVVSGLEDVTYDATFNWIAGDEDAGFDETSSLIGRYNSGWSYPTMGSRTATSAQIVNQTSFSDFQVANGQSIEFSACPSNINVNNDEGYCSAVVTYVPTISTTLSVDDYSLSYVFTGATTAGGTGTGSGSTFNKGTTNVTITAVSTFETIECNFTIQVTDNEKPEILNIPSNITVNNEAGVCSSRVSWTAPTATDNCGIASLVSNYAPNTRFAVGTTTITYTATDVNGNTQTASFAVTVIDNEKPRVIGMPIDLFRVSDPGSCEKSVSWPEPVVKDNCGVASVTSTHDSGYIFLVGETTVTYSITDIHGNILTRSFVVTIHDGERPKIEGIEMIPPAP
jgi:hypothetical protein